MELSGFEYFDKYDLVILDLDNTLYDEKEYLWKSYDLIADRLEVSNKFEISDYLKREFLANGRNNLFDKLVAKYNLSVSISTIINWLHSYSGDICLYEKAECLLDYLFKVEKFVYVLTNGNIQQQKNKINSLHLLEKFPKIKIVYASNIAPKPAPDCISFILKESFTTSKKTLMIGDSNIDCQTAKNANIDFVYIDNIYRNIDLTTYFF